MLRRLGVAFAAAVFACSPVTSTSSVANEIPNRLCTDYAAGNFTAENMGDSVGEGYGAPAPKRWLNQVAAQLPAGSAVWNGAVSGSVVGDYLPGGSLYFHTQFTKAVQPSLVITNWRINDQWMSIDHEAQGFSPATFKDRYRQVLAEIRSASPTTTFMIAVSPWILDTRIDAGRYTQWDYIQALWELKVEFDAIWMDWMRFFPKAGESNSAGLLMYDLGHPSVSGQSVLAAHTYERIASYCQGVLS